VHPIGMTGDARVAESLTLTYDGPGLANGTMPVRDLAPALLAFADAIQEAHRAVDPRAQLPAVQVSAIRQGSFAIDLLVSEQSLLGQVRDLFAGDDATAAANAAEIVSAAVVGTLSAFKVVKRLRGRKISRTEEVRPGWVRITFDDGVTLEVPGTSYELVQWLPFRQSVHDVVAPLETEDVDSLVITHEEEELSVGADEAAAFEVPDVRQELVVDSTRTAAVRIMNLGFAEGNKWRVSDGDQAIWVTIADKAFIDRVLQLRTRQYNTADGLHNDHMITRVHEHIPAPRQIALPLSDPEAENDEGDQPPFLPPPPDDGPPALT
jgi:hypothetical protein